LDALALNLYAKVNNIFIRIIRRKEKEIRLYLLV